MTTNSKFKWLLAGVVLIALALRLWAIFSLPVLANDEAALAWSIETRGFAGLLKPLEFGQGAPIGFLMLSEAAERLFGSTPATYRLIPLIFGVLAVAGLGLLASRLLPLPVALAVALMSATSGSLVEYSAFFKQYSLDAFAAVLLLLAFSTLALKPSTESLSRKDWRPLLASGMVLPWFSHPSVFVFFGGAAILLVAFIRSGRVQDLRTLLVGCAAVAGSFLLHYLGFARHLNESDSLREFWRQFVLPEPVAAAAVAKWVVRSALDWAATSLGLSPETTVGRFWAVVALSMASLGIRALWRRDRVIAALLVSPVVVAFAAACLRMYPFSGRLLLFVVPVFLLLMAAGATAVARQPRAAASVLGIASLALLAVWIRPHGNEGAQLDLAQGCRSIAPQIGDRDHVYIFYPNRIVCFYALVHADAPPHALTAGAGDSPSAFGAVHHVTRELGALPIADWRHVWVVLSHPRLRDGRDEGDLALAHFRSLCGEQSLERRGEVRIVKFLCTPDAGP